MAMFSGGSIPSKPQDQYGIGSAWGGLQLLRFKSRRFNCSFANTGVYVVVCWSSLLNYFQLLPSFFIYFIFLFLFFSFFLSLFSPGFFLLWFFFPFSFSFLSFFKKKLSSCELTTFNFILWLFWEIFLIINIMFKIQSWILFYVFINTSYQNTPVWIKWKTRCDSDWQHFLIKLLYSYIRNNVKARQRQV